MHKEIVSIAQIFPGFEKKIDFLFQTDENFHDLCSDYVLCTSMLHKGQKELNIGNQKINEFKDLQRELENEIREEILKKSKLPPL